MGKHIWLAHGYLKDLCIKIAKICVSDTPVFWVLVKPTNMCKSCKIGISTKNPSEIWNFLCYSLFICFYTTSFCSFYVLAKKSPPKSFCMHQELTRLLARLEQKNVRSTFPSLTHYIYSDIHFLQQTHTYTYAHTHTMLVLNNNLLEGRERERERLL